MGKEEMTCGVPQGSILRPLLWNITFDNILKEEVPPGYHLLCRRYPGGYGRGWYPHAWVECEHHPSGYDPLDRVCRTELSNNKDGSGAVYTPLLVQSPLVPPKGGADKALNRPKVLGVVVWWKADFQGACQADSSQNWEGCREQCCQVLELRRPYSAL